MNHGAVPQRRSAGAFSERLAAAEISFAAFPAQHLQDKEPILPVSDEAQRMAVSAGERVDPVAACRWRSSSSTAVTSHVAD